MLKQARGLLPKGSKEGAARGARAANGTLQECVMSSDGSQSPMDVAEKMTSSFIYAWPGRGREHHDDLSPVGIQANSSAQGAGEEMGGGAAGGHVLGEDGLFSSFPVLSSMSAAGDAPAAEDDRVFSNNSNNGRVERLLKTLVTKVDKQGAALLELTAATRAMQRTLEARERRGRSPTSTDKPNPQSVALTREKSPRGRDSTYKARNPADVVMIGNTSSAAKMRQASLHALRAGAVQPRAIGLEGLSPPVTPTRPRRGDGGTDAVADADKSPETFASSPAQESSKSPDEVPANSPVHASPVNAAGGGTTEHSNGGARSSGYNSGPISESWISDLSEAEGRLAGSLPPLVQIGSNVHAQTLNEALRRGQRVQSGGRGRGHVGVGGGGGGRGGHGAKLEKGATAEHQLTQGEFSRPGSLESWTSVNGEAALALKEHIKNSVVAKPAHTAHAPPPPSLSNPASSLTAQQPAHPSVPPLPLPVRLPAPVLPYQSSPNSPLPPPTTPPLLSPRSPHSPLSFNYPPLRDAPSPHSSLPSPRSNITPRTTQAAAVNDMLSPRFAQMTPRSDASGTPRTSKVFAVTDFPQSPRVCVCVCVCVCMCASVQGL